MVGTTCHSYGSHLRAPLLRKHILSLCPCCNYRYVQSVVLTSASSDQEQVRDHRGRGKFVVPELLSSYALNVSECHKTLWKRNGRLRKTGAYGDSRALLCAPPPPCINIAMNDHKPCVLRGFRTRTMHEP